ncbi:MAG: hypothetical protein IT441_00320 [Phycisphaeraceae bacterium]|nr:hypothetical protein [Phycisphaeraceae bacterium]
MATPSTSKHLDRFLKLQLNMQCGALTPPQQWVCQTQTGRAEHVRPRHPMRRLLAQVRAVRRSADHSYGSDTLPTLRA